MALLNPSYELLAVLSMAREGTGIASSLACPSDGERAATMNPAPVVMPQPGLHPRGTAREWGRAGLTRSCGGHRLIGTPLFREGRKRLNSWIVEEKERKAEGLPFNSYEEFDPGSG